MNVIQKWIRPIDSFMNRPNIFGNQKYSAANIPKIDATPITRWKCAGTMYVSCIGRSSELCPRINPVIPPATKSETNPIANNIAVVKRMRAPHNVPSQLKVLTADGTPIESVNTENAIAEYGLMPLMNMWWPQTKKPSSPIAKIANTIARYPKTGLRANVARMFDG